MLFTYDGWIDVSYLSGEVKDPKRHLSRGLGFGVAAVTLLYLLVNYAYSASCRSRRCEPRRRRSPPTRARVVFGPTGGAFLNALVMLSIFGALGGLIMTLPRLYYAAAAQYARDDRRRRRGAIFRALSFITPRTAVPAGSVFCRPPRPLSRSCSSARSHASSTSSSSRCS